MAWQSIGAEPAVAAPGLADGESAELRAAPLQPLLCQLPRGTAATWLPWNWPGTQRCGQHMGASVQWGWGQGEARACAGAGTGVLAGWSGRAAQPLYDHHVWAGRDAHGGYGVVSLRWPLLQGRAASGQPSGVKLSS